MTFNFQKTTVFDTYYEEWKSKKYRRQVDRTATTNVSSLDFTLSKDLTPKTISHQSFTIANGVLSAIETAKKNNRLPIQKDEFGNRLTIPFGPGIPLALRIDVGVNEEFNVGLYGGIKITDEEAVTEITTITDGDKETTEKKTVKDASLTRELYVYGEGYVQINPKLSLGILVGDGVTDTGVGIEASIGVKLKAGAKIQPRILDDFSEDISGSTFYFNYGPSFQINVFCDVLHHN